MSEQELAGKVAIVTGAGRNIGRAIALALADAGAAVVVNVRSNKAEADGVVREIEAAGGKAAAQVGDVADAEDGATARRARARRNSSASISWSTTRRCAREKPIEQMSYAEWRGVLDVTLDGAFHCVKACLPALKKRRRHHHQYRRHERAYRLDPPRPRDDRQGRARRLHPRPRARSRRRQDHRQLRGARRHRHRAAGRRAKPGASSHPRHHHRRARQAARMSPPWCAFWRARAGASSPARPSMSAAAPISGRSRAAPRKC